MASARWVIGDVLPESLSKVALVENDDIIEEFASDTPDPALRNAVLPGRAWRSEHLGDAHASHPSPELGTVDVVAIAEEVARRRVTGERLDDLLRSPGGTGGIGDVEVHDLAAMMQQDPKP